MYLYCDLCSHKFKCQSDEECQPFRPIRQSDPTTKAEMAEMIRKAVPLPALLEQAAEEAAELAQAALKLARIIRKENPTPTSEDLAIAHVTEELTDLDVVLDVLNFYPDAKIHLDKLKRWWKRVKDRNGEI